MTRCPSTDRAAAAPTPTPAVSAHACATIQPLAHLEYFHDHVRIESLLFDGTLSPDGGALRPDRTRAGLGLELKRTEVQRYRA